MVGCVFHDKRSDSTLSSPHRSGLCHLVWAHQSEAPQLFEWLQCFSSIVAPPSPLEEGVLQSFWALSEHSGQLEETWAWLAQVLLSLELRYLVSLPCIGACQLACCLHFSVTVMSRNDTVWGPVSYELDGGVGLVEMLQVVHMVKTSYCHQICGFFSGFGSLVCLWRCWHKTGLHMYPCLCNGSASSVDHPGLGPLCIDEYKLLSSKIKITSRFESQKKHSL